PVGQQGEVQFRAGFLVGEQDVAFARAGRAAGQWAAVDHGHGQAGGCGVVRAGRADDAGADDDDVRTAGHGASPRAARAASRWPGLRAGGPEAADVAEVAGDDGLGTRAVAGGEAVDQVQVFGGGGGELAAFGEL